MPKYGHDKCFIYAQKRIETICFKLYELQLIDCLEGKMAVHFTNLKEIEEKMQAIRRAHKESK